MDKEYSIAGEKANTYLENCQGLLDGYLTQLPEVESLQEFISINAALVAGYTAAFEMLMADAEEVQ